MYECYVFGVFRSCNFFFFKQKTAYEMRISDWSSDVCSSDLNRRYRDVGDMTENRKKVPRVSIGLPVHNGGLLLPRALDSILGQSFPDFELILSDNASTDATAAICRDYAGREGRIRYFRQDRNLGAAGNFNFTFAQATGAYFKWAAHDDVLAPGFLTACVDLLSEDAGAVLAFTDVRLVNEDASLLPYDQIGRAHV